MTDQKQPDPAKAGTIAQQIVTILTDEDSETRRRAIQAAMMLLGEEPLAPMNPQSELERSDSAGDDHTVLAGFFNRDEKFKPSDYAYLCAAYHFSIYGFAVFSLDDLRTIAREAGVILPDRLDMTLKSAANSGKKLFQVLGRDGYKPTATAGMLFKDRWGVNPGRRAKDTMATKE